MNQRVATRFLFLFFLLSASMYITQAQQPSENLLNSQTDKSYRIKIGDLLAINISAFTHGYRELRVDCNGMIVLPLIGKIKPEGQTIKELKSELETKYSEYIIKPELEVSLKESQKDIPIAVIGAVKNPSKFILKRQVRLLEVFQLVGGVSDETNHKVRIIHKGCKSASNELKEDFESIAVYSWKDVFSGDEKFNPLLKSGDVIEVFAADTVFVIGNVFHPQIITHKKPLTLRQAIATVGGLKKNSKTDKIIIFRKYDDRKIAEIAVNLIAIEKGRISDFLLEPNDIVYVPRGKISEGGHRVAPGNLPVKVLQ